MACFFGFFMAIHAPSADEAMTPRCMRMAGYGEIADGPEPRGISDRRKRMSTMPMPPITPDRSGFSDFLAEIMPHKSAEAYRETMDKIGRAHV